MKRLTDIVVKQVNRLNGTVKASPSKSYTHRALIAAALSEGTSNIENALICDDTLATVNACSMLGAEIHQTKEGTFEVRGHSKLVTPTDVVNCKDSASTMRFLTPVCVLADGISVLTGGDSLRRRPMNPALTALRQLGVQCYSTRGNGCPPLVVFGGKIPGGKTCLRGDISSQFVSGLLFAAPMAEKDVDIVLSTPLVSKPYVKMTLKVLQEHGVHVKVQSGYGKIHVPSQQKYKPHDHAIEGDYSSAAFLLAAAAITDSHVKVENLARNSVQGDRAIVDLLTKMNVQVNVGEDFVEVHGLNGELKPVNVDLRDNPDLVPVCAVLCCLAAGKSVIRSVKRLRFKESDRIAALLSELTKLGAKINASNDVLEIEGVPEFHAAQLDSHGDHRIAMACVVAALRTRGRTVIRGVECINKSYPKFLRDIVHLGGEIVER